MTDEPRNDNEPLDDPGGSVDSWLAAMGRAPVPGPSADYVDGLELQLRSAHPGRVARPRALRVLVPALAAAAMVLAVALVARPGGEPSPADLANDGFRPGFASSSTTPERDDPSISGDEDPDSSDRTDDGDASNGTEGDNDAPNDDERPTDAPTTTAAVERDPAPDPVPDPEPGPTRSTLPPEKSTTTTSSTPTTEPSSALRVVATRTDDGRVLIRWTDPGRDDVAGWRLRRLAAKSDREPEIIFETREPAVRRHLDTPPPDADRLAYFLVALDANGKVVAEASTTVR